MSSTLHGTGIGRGIVIGQIRRQDHGLIEVGPTCLAKELLEDEVERYRAALNAAQTQLTQISENTTGQVADEINAFIDSHLLMLQDEVLAEGVEKRIREHHCTAEWALQQQRDELMSAFDAMDDAYLSTRRDDVAHVADRVLRILLGLAPESSYPLIDVAQNKQASILVVDDMPPAELVALHNQGLEAGQFAFVTQRGGPLSHTAVLARSLEIPAIIGLHEALDKLTDGATVVLDARNGLLITSPTAAELERFTARQQEEIEQRTQLISLRSDPAITKDGVRIALRANVELPNDIKQAQEYGAEGIGLYRTEFLFLSPNGKATAPDEAAHMTAYARLLGHDWPSLTIRTYDLGSDKQFAPNLPQPGANPALGLRAIRLTLHQPDLFRPQLRALLRTAAAGPIRILLPMVSTIDELQQAKQIINDVREELLSEGHNVPEHVAIGIMIEVPAAALMARQFAEHCDFMSLGTNDLIQYTIAIDRNDETVTHLYDPLHPAVMRLIRETIDAGAASNTPVSMCGELAGDPAFTRLLLGIGLNEFSMHPASLLEIKSIIVNSDLSQLRSQASEVIHAIDPGAAHAALARINIGL